MQSRLIEFSKLAQQNDSKGMIQFINHSMENGRKDEMKSIIALTRLNMGGITSNSCVNIYQYAIAHSNELLAVLKKHNLTPVSSCKSEGLVESAAVKHAVEHAVEHNHYHFISVDNAAKIKLLYQAAIAADFKTISLLLDYLPRNIPLSSCYINERTKKMEKYPANPVTVQKFKNNLFLLFKGAQYDEKSVVCEVNADCIRTMNKIAY